MNSSITIAKAIAKPPQPAQSDRAGENDGGDLVGDRGVGVPWFEHRIEPADLGEFTGGCVTLMPSPAPDSDCAPPQDTWCADGR